MFLTPKNANLYVFSSLNRNFVLSLWRFSTNHRCIGYQSSVKWKSQDMEKMLLPVTGWGDPKECNIVIKIYQKFFKR